VRPLLWETRFEWRLLPSCSPNAGEGIGRGPYVPCSSCFVIEPLADQLQPNCRLMEVSAARRFSVMNHKGGVGKHRFVPSS
jgi:hypothetical protein